MATRVVEGKKPYTGGKAISIDENKVISLNLRDENNLIIYDEGDDEIYVDLQLDDEITPTSAFPIGVNVGRVIVDNGWDKPGTIISAETTSGDNIKIFYADEGTLWIDNGTGTFKQIYFKADVDALLLALRNYIDGELAKKQNGVASDTEPENRSEGDLWYDTTNDVMKVWDGTAWQSVGTGGGGSEIEYKTQAEYNALLPGALTDNKHYFIYSTSGGGGGWQPGVNTIAYYPLKSDFNDASGNGYNLINETGAITTAGGIACAYYDGSSRSYNTSAPVGTKRTLSAWIYNPGSSGVILGTGENSDSWYGMFVALSNSELQISDFYQIGIQGGTVSQNVWHNVIGVNDNTSMKIYVDGVLKNSTTHTRTDASTGVSVGGKPFTNQYVDKATVYVSEAIFENSAWTDQEVADYFDLTKGDYGIS